MLTVTVLAGPPGCGKSSQMRAEAIANPGLYLFSLPTAKLLEEQVAAFRAEAPNLCVIEAHSGLPGKRPVWKRIAEACASLRTKGHGVVLITHEALTSTDLSGLAGWHARIDEVPNSVVTGRLNISRSLAFFRENFRLDPVGSNGWSQVLWANGRLTWREVESDGLAKHASKFIEQVGRPQGAFVKISDWDEATAGPVEWFSIWTPLELNGFASVTIAGAGVLKSIFHEVCTTWCSQRVSFIPKALPLQRSAFPTVRVHYFTKGHEGSTVFWDTSDGRRCLSAIQNHFKAHVTNLGFWSANEDVWKRFEHEFLGELVGAKVAGLNILQSHRSCAFIYSSKAVPDDAPLQKLFGMTDAEIEAARESEDIAQFVMRGALRNPEFGGDYDVYLYSLRQAEELGRYLANEGIAGVVELVPVEAAGIMEFARPKEKRQPTEDEEAARRAKAKRGAAERSERCRAKKAIREGREPGLRGRPPRRPRAPASPGGSPSA